MVFVLFFSVTPKYNIYMLTQQKQHSQRSELQHLRIIQLEFNCKAFALVIVLSWLEVQKYLKCIFFSFITPHKITSQTGKYRNPRKGKTQKQPSTDCRLLFQCTIFHGSPFHSVHHEFPLTLPKFEFPQIILFQIGQYNFTIT